MDLEGSPSSGLPSTPAPTPASSKSTPSESYHQGNNNNNNNKKSDPSRIKTSQSRSQSHSSSPSSSSSSSSSPSSSTAAAARAAVRFSTMQASFAEKTAAEMEEIVRWFSDHPQQERFVVVNQSDSLPNNAMVYEEGTAEIGTTTTAAAANTSDEEDSNDDISDDRKGYDDETTESDGRGKSNDGSSYANTNVGMMMMMKTPNSVKAKFQKKMADMQVITPFSPDVMEQIQTSDELIRATQYMADVIGELKAPFSPSSWDCDRDRSTGAGGRGGGSDSTGDVTASVSTFRTTTVTTGQADGSKNEGTPSNNKISDPSCRNPTLSSTPTTMSSAHRPESPSTLSSSSTTVELASLPSSSVNRSYAPGVGVKSTPASAPLDGTKNSRTSTVVQNGKRVTRIDDRPGWFKIISKKRKKARVAFVCVVVTTLLCVLLLLIKIQGSNRVGMITGWGEGSSDILETSDDEFITNNKSAPARTFTKLTTVGPKTIDDGPDENQRLFSREHDFTDTATEKRSSIALQETGENTMLGEDVDKIEL